MLVRGHALRQQLASGRIGQPFEERLDCIESGRRERRLDRLLAQRAHVGESHAVGREHAGERMDEHALHAQRVGDRAGVLAARAAEAAQRVFGDVVAALHRDVLDRVAPCCRPRCCRKPSATCSGAAHVPGRRGDRPPRARRTSRARPRASSGCSPLGPEHAWKERGLDLAEHHVAVGHGERAAAPVATPAPDSRPPTRDRRGGARRRSCRSSRRRRRPCGCASSARACARPRPRSRRRARTRRRSARRRSRCRPCRSR